MSELIPQAPEIYSIKDARRGARLSFLAAVASGVLLALSFPPLGWWPLAFVGLLPVLIAPVPQKKSARIVNGFAFGYSHFLIALWWLNSVGFGAGALLALVCACFPMAWYCFHSAVVWSAKPREILSDHDSRKRALAHIPGAGLWVFASHGRLLGAALISSAAWISLEWLRSWIFTGFPWDMLGTSQAFAPTRVFATLAGIYGISFVAMLCNILLADSLLRAKNGKSILSLALLLGFVALWCGKEFLTPENMTEPAVKIAAVQGNTPECREWSPEELAFSWQSYSTLTLQAVAENAPDMLLWPEGAMPCSITWEPYAQGLRELLQKVKTPLLMGALDERDGFPDEIPRVFNSAFLLNENSPLLLTKSAPRTDFYDKMHLVPFGEFVPFSRYLPWLADAIGMGRDLTAGENYTLFRLPRKDGTDLTCGVNICFEDAFPEISRRFSLGGAQMLITITNDCWYKKSAGARQHLAHAVFRAIENRRPLLRSGNNSDTCFITPNGTIHEATPEFQACHRLYTVQPVPANAPLTLYAVTGNLFAWLCTLATIVALTAMIAASFRRKALLHDGMENAKRLRLQQLRGLKFGDAGSVSSGKQ
ncbi:MAG: apolipoprotein N-acyltransferase [Lentisphaeria bacterium]|nr:apolipoprotein N-acyltransferase [Lentisphaeria bacterium]